MARVQLYRDVVTLVIVLSVLCSGSSQFVAGNSDADNFVGIQDSSNERMLANRLLERLMDVAYVTFKELGGSDTELKQLEHKRGVITRCYFSAVSCY